MRITRCPVLLSVQVNMGKAAVYAIMRFAVRANNVLYVISCRGKALSFVRQMVSVLRWECLDKYYTQNG
jgi:hypothetical protein